MGCSDFLEKPWGFKDDRIVRELLDGVSNEFDNSIRGQPIRWTFQQGLVADWLAGRTNM
jgi:hypothetical protein